MVKQSKSKRKKVTKPPDRGSYSSEEEFSDIDEQNQTLMRKDPNLKDEQANFENKDYKSK